MKSNGVPCMFTTETPQRKKCVLTPKLEIIFPNYVTRVRNRLLRIFEDNLTDSEITDSDDDGSPEPKKQKITFKNGAVNDSGPEYTDLTHVHKTDEGVTYACTLTKTDPLMNINKFYKLKILKDDKSDGIWLLREYGRTGTNIGCPIYTSKSIDVAMKDFEKMYKKLTGNFWTIPPLPEITGKYVHLLNDYKELECVQTVTNLLSLHNLDKPVEELMHLMFSNEIMEQTLMEMEIDAKVMPHGALSHENLNEASKILTLIKEDIDNRKPDMHQDFVRNSMNFYNLVPHCCAPEKSLPILNNYGKISRKFELLNKLRNVEVSFKFSEKNNPILESYRCLNSSLVTLSPDLDEYQIIQEYCNNKFSDDHAGLEFEIKDIFKVNCVIDERFKPHKTCKNRKLLWHGSKIANFPSILKHGLRVSPPSEVPENGKMFGRGIYFADMVSKAAYFANCHSKQKHALLMLCEVALGEEYEVTKKLGKNFNKQDLPEGKTSIKALGKTFPCNYHTSENGVKVPLGYPEFDENIKSDVNFNEYIVFDESRIKMEYLVRIQFEN